MSIPPTIDQILANNADHQCPEGMACVRIVAIADLPTRFGDFQVVAYSSPHDGKDHAALVPATSRARHPSRCASTPSASRGTPSRPSGATAASSSRRPWSRLAPWTPASSSTCVRRAAASGFANKIRAYQLQEAGYDTNEANEALGFGVDERDYEIAAHMLRSLGVASIQLLSNNPEKIADLKRHGIIVESRIPIVIPPNPHNARYLETKRVRSGHLLSPFKVQEQIDSGS